MKYLKWAFFALLLIIGIAIFCIIIFSEKKPEGKSGNNADALAQKMLKSLNYDAFTKTKYFRWSFPRGHHYFFNQNTNQAIIKWDEHKVIMQLDTQEGQAFTDETLITDDAQRKALMDKAWSYWCNDSFWMFAPFKVFDPGTTRKIVEEDGKEALLIEYKSGGVTPGDSYLWILDENYRPTGYKMWTSIIPVKGMYSSWENWEQHNGAYYATNHNMKMELKMDNFLASDTLADFGYQTNPFQ